MTDSKIEWTQKTWNPWIGCTRISPGCKNCYAGREEDTRFRHLGRCLRSRDGGVHALGAPYFFKGPVFQGMRKLTEPIRRRKPTMYFVGSRTDIFHDKIPFEYLDRLFAVMAISTQHTFQLLTKRPARMLEYLQTRTAIDDSGKHERCPQWYQTLTDWFDEGAVGFFGVRWGHCHRVAGGLDLVSPLPNVWLGVTAEDQQRADERVPLLLKCPAAVHFVSHEPALGPIDWNLTLGWIPKQDGKLDWLITGGESGPGARPMHPAWARADRDACDYFGVPFFFKQWGEFAPWGIDCCDYLIANHNCDTADKSFTSAVCSPYVMYRVGKKKAGRLLEGRVHDAMPEVAQ